MKFTFNYQEIIFSSARWGRIVAKQLEEDLKQGGQIWIEAAISKIPVWKGASRGTFIKLASKVGYSVATSGSTVSQGVARSTGSIAIFDGAFVLRYSTSLLHLIYNEYNNANATGFFHLNTPGPYDFQGTANEAFYRFAKHVRMPSPQVAFRYINRKV
jgi:hypothetical protein